MPEFRKKVGQPVHYSATAYGGHGNVSAGELGKQTAQSNAASERLHYASSAYGGHSSITTADSTLAGTGRNGGSERAQKDFSSAEPSLQSVASTDSSHLSHYASPGYGGQRSVITLTGQNSEGNTLRQTPPASFNPDAGESNHYASSGYGGQSSVGTENLNRPATDRNDVGQTDHYASPSYGGQISERSGHFRGRGPRSYQPADARIEEQINARLTDDPEIDPYFVQVSTEQGVVRLSGFVATERERSRTEAVARNVFGVKTVSNDLEIKPNATSESEMQRSQGNEADSEPGPSQPEHEDNGEATSVDDGSAANLEIRGKSGRRKAGSRAKEK